MVAQCILNFAIFALGTCSMKSLAVEDKDDGDGGHDGDGDELQHLMPPL